MNERRFNHEIDRINITLGLYGLPLLSPIDLGAFRGNINTEMKRLKKIAKRISIGPKTYFASQVVSIVNNELDRRNL